MTPKDHIALKKIFDEKLSPLTESVRSLEQTLRDPDLGLIVAHKKNTRDIQELKDGRAKIYGVSSSLGFITGAISAFLASLFKSH